MSLTRVLDFNPITGEAVLFTDNQDGTFNLTHTQDVEPIIERNKKLANETQRSRKGIKRNWWHYATIPNVVLLKWSREVGGNILARQYEAELFKRLNAPEHAYLRSTHGRHAVKG